MQPDALVAVEVVPFQRSFKAKIVELFPELVRVPLHGFVTVEQSTSIL
jgi:hypothetical protein